MRRRTGIRLDRGCLRLGKVVEAYEDFICDVFDAINATVGDVKTDNIVDCQRLRLKICKFNL